MILKCFFRRNKMLEYHPKGNFLEIFLSWLNEKASLTPISWIWLTFLKIVFIKNEASHCLHPRHVTSPPLWGTQPSLVCSVTHGIWLMQPSLLGSCCILPTSFVTAHHSLSITNTLLSKISFLQTEPGISKICGGSATFLVQQWHSPLVHHTPHHSLWSL